MFGIKEYIYGGVVMVMVASAWYVAVDWHYKPIRLLTEERNTLESNLRVVGNSLNVCEANLSRQLLQGYLDGLEGNDEDTVIDFSNITY